MFSLTQRLRCICFRVREVCHKYVEPFLILFGKVELDFKFTSYHCIKNHELESISYYLLMFSTVPVHPISLTSLMSRGQANLNTPTPSTLQNVF